MKRYTYVMTGICMSLIDFNKAGFDIFDEKFLPLVEGHNDISLELHYDEGDNVFIGRIVAQSEPYSDRALQKLQFPSHQEIAGELDRCGFNVCGSDIDNWFFDIYK